MPLQNRVSPEGYIESHTARGSLMGNRGVLHNNDRQLTRLFKNKAWIICLLSFKDRKRQLMSPGLYTELFFLDEVTAFAAGHRPCAECQRARYNEFKEAWSAANGLNSTVRAPELDNILHEERIISGSKVTWKSSLAALPHGTMFRVSERRFAVCDDRILAWDFTGYQTVPASKLPETVEVLTPKSVVAAFSGGFRPHFHSSATG